MQSHSSSEPQLLCSIAHVLLYNYYVTGKKPVFIYSTEAKPSAELAPIFNYSLALTGFSCINCTSNKKVTDLFICFMAQV
jgi:hypothetical protein